MSRAALLSVVLLACGARTGLPEHQSPSDAGVDVDSGVQCPLPWVVFYAHVESIAKGRGGLPAAVRVDGSDRHIIDVLAPREGLLRIAASGDRTAILFTTYDLDGHRPLSRISRWDFATSTRTEVETGTLPSQLSESGDGKLIAYDDVSSVRVYSRATSTERTLRDQLYPSRPFVDATGTSLLLIASDSAFQRSLLRFPLDGGPAEILASTGDHTGSMALAPDGHRFAVPMTCQGSAGLRMGTLPLAGPALSQDELCSSTTAIAQGDTIKDTSWGVDDWITFLRDDRLVAMRPADSLDVHVLTSAIEVHSPDVISGCVALPSGPAF